MLRLIARVVSRYTVYTTRVQSRPLTGLTSFIVGHKPVNVTVKETLTPNCWSRTEHRKARKLLRRGATIPAIATRLEESEVAVKWSLSLKSDEHPISKLGTIRKKKFSEEEDEYILELWKFGLPRLVIEKYLGRSCTSIKTARLTRLTEKLISDDRQSVHQGPQALTPEIEESVFQARLRKLWHGLSQLEMTETWREILSRESPESWIFNIAKNTPPGVKKLLASHEPPTVAKLEALPWTSTEKAGVYGWLLKPKEDLYLNSHCYLYIGSGSRVGHGLEGRKLDHLSKGKEIHNPRLLRLVKEKELQRNGYFFTLLTFDMDSAQQPETVIRMRSLVTLAEAIFSMWLGAFGERGFMYERNFSHLYPWGVSEVPYNGCCSHNPLSKDINTPKVVQCASDEPLPRLLPEKSVFSFRYKDPRPRKKRKRRW